MVLQDLVAETHVRLRLEDNDIGGNHDTTLIQGVLRMCLVEISETCAQYMCCFVITFLVTTRPLTENMKRI